MKNRILSAGGGEPILIDYAMMILLLGLFLCTIFKARLHSGGNPDFFDLENTKAMRGLWCIVVVLVHTPAAYQNRIQDLVGSFAYIGVTFYFMASAYGLSLGMRKRPQSIRVFWRNRLPKLLIPQLLVNVLFCGLSFLLFREVPTVKSLLDISPWTKWLLVCYFFFWLSHLLCKDAGGADLLLCVLVTAFSLVLYCLKSAGIVTATIWSTEIFGFLWGLLLAAYLPKMQALCKHKWLLKCAVSCGIALLLGLAYLKCKPVVFLGDYLLKIGLGLAIIGFILLLNTRISLGNKISSFLGGISYEVYLVHYYVFSLTARLLDGLSSGVYILLCIFGSVLCSAVIHRICGYLLKRLYAIPWFGKKASGLPH